MLSIMQGDAYPIPICLKLNGTALTPDDVELVKFCLGAQVKTFPGEVEYRDGKFYYPMTQQESFSLPAGNIAFLIRTKLKNTHVKGWLTQLAVYVQPCSDKEII